MLNKEEELGCFEILKRNFPDLNRRGLVIGLYEFLQPDVNLQSYFCKEKSVKDAAAEYARQQKPYIIMDETEGYKCLFFRGHYIRAHYDVSEERMIKFIEAEG